MHLHSDRVRCWAVLLLCSAAAFLPAGPGIAAGPRDGGEKRFHWPGKERWREASMNALKSAGTWAPAATAAVVAGGSWDDDISHWAVRRTPLFGSPHKAREWSDHLRGVAHAGMIASALVSPGGEEPWRSRFERLLVQHGAVQVNNAVTLGLKKATRRERPDHSDNLSFPSGHASQAFAYAAMARRNLAAPGMPERAGAAFGIGLTTVASATAWARVEGGVHSPTDVLVGAALGNFLGVLIDDAFFPERRGPAVAFSVDRRSFYVGVSLK